MKIENIPASEFNTAKKLARKMCHQEIYVKMNEMEIGDAITITYDDADEFNDPDFAYRAYRGLYQHIDRTHQPFDICYIRSKRRIYILKTRDKTKKDPPKATIKDYRLTGSFTKEALRA